MLHRPFHLANICPSYSYSCSGGQGTPFSGILNICCIWASPFSLFCHSEGQDVTTTTAKPALTRRRRRGGDGEEGERNRERERTLFTRGWVSFLGLLRRVGGVSTVSTDKLQPLEGKWCYYFARPSPPFSSSSSSLSFHPLIIM